jgi:hypothetical protein
MMVKSWARVGAVAVLVVLSGCTPSERNTPGPSAPPATAGLGDRAAGPGAEAHRFITPSKNIGCFVSPESARCDIAEKSWKAPPKPAGCQLGWGNGLAVGVDGETSIVCAGDTVLGGPRTLPYGESVRAGDFVCASSAEGVRCTNEPTGHGFTLSRKSYEIF